MQKKIWVGESSTTAPFLTCAVLYYRPLRSPEMAVSRFTRVTSKLLRMKLVDHGETRNNWININPNKDVQLCLLLWIKQPSHSNSQLPSGGVVRKLSGPRIISCPLALATSEDQTWQILDVLPLVSDKSPKRIVRHKIDVAHSCIGRDGTNLLSWWDSQAPPEPCVQAHWMDTLVGFAARSGVVSRWLNPWQVFII